MTKTIDGEEYLDTQEVLEELQSSKKRFYSNVKPHLEVKHFEGKKTPWYRKRDIIAIKEGKSVRRASISISGIQRDWSTYLRSLGYHVETIDRTIEIMTLPADAVETFHLDANQQFAKRGRMTLADNVPICTWDTYYPLELVQSEILDSMKNGTASDVVKLIKEKHGVVIRRAKDKYTARTAALEEQQLLKLFTNDPVLILQRVSYTAEHKLVLYSDMTLLGSWFAPEHEYDVDIWS